MYSNIHRRPQFDTYLSLMRFPIHVFAAITMIKSTLAVPSSYTNASSETISSYSYIKSFHPLSQSVTIITPSSASIWTSSKDTSSATTTESEPLIISSDSSTTKIQSFVVSSSVSKYTSSSNTLSSTPTIMSPILTGEVVNSNVPLWTILVPGSMGTWEYLQVEITKSGIGGSFVYDQAALKVNDVTDSSAGVDISSESIFVEYDKAVGFQDLVTITFGASITGASSNWTSQAVLTVTFPGEKKLSKRSYTVSYTFDHTIETKNDEVVEPSATTAVSSGTSSGTRGTSPGSDEASSLELISSVPWTFSGVTFAQPDTSSGASSVELETSPYSNTQGTISNGETENSSNPTASAADPINSSTDPQISSTDPQISSTDKQENSSNELSSSIPYQSISLITPSTAPIWSPPSESFTYSRSAFQSESFIFSSSSFMPGEHHSISSSEPFASELFVVSTTTITSDTEPASATSSSTSSITTALVPIFSGSLNGNIPEWTIKIPGGLGPWSALDIDITKIGIGGPFTFSDASIEEDGVETDSKGIHLTADTINFEFDEFIGNRNYLSFTFAGKISARGSNWTARAHIVISRPGKGKLSRRDEIAYDIEYTISTPGGEEIDPSHSSSDVVSPSSKISSVQSPITSSSETSTAYEMTKKAEPSGVSLFGQALESSGSIIFSTTVTSTETTFSDSLLTPVTTTGDHFTTVTVISCNADRCTTEAVITGYAVFTTSNDGIITSYTTYCPLSEVQKTATEQAASATVVTVTSCSAEASNAAPKATGYNVITTSEAGVVKTYITYFPVLTKSQATKADSQNGDTTAASNPYKKYTSTALSFTTCHEGSCSEIPITKAYTVISTTENGTPAISTSFISDETNATNDDTVTTVSEADSVTAVAVAIDGTAYVESAMTKSLISTISETEQTDDTTTAHSAYATGYSASTISDISPPATVYVVTYESSDRIIIGGTENFAKPTTSYDDRTSIFTITATDTRFIAPAHVDTTSESTIPHTSSTTLRAGTHQTSVITTAISERKTRTLSAYEGSGSRNAFNSLAALLAVLWFI